MHVAIIDPQQDDRWDTFVRTHQFGSFYHLSGWANVLVRTFKYKALYFVLEKGRNIIAGIPFMLINSVLTGKRLVSLPRTPYCDPLVKNELESKLILKHVEEITKNENCDYFELKPHFNHKVLEYNGFRRCVPFTNHMLKLDKPPSELWTSFHRSCVRQRVRKAEDFHVKVRVGSTIDDVKIFYRLYRSTCKKHEVPGRPFSFFCNIWQTFLRSHSVFVLIAELNEKPAAAAMVFIFNDVMYYEYLGLKYDLIEFCPGHLLLWTAIQEAYKRNCKYFDFGVTHRDNMGLRSFKKRWGAEESDLSSFYYPDASGYKQVVENSCTHDASKSTILAKSKAFAKVEAARVLTNHFG